MRYILKASRKIKYGNLKKYIIKPKLYHPRTEEGGSTVIWGACLPRHPLRVIWGT